MVKDKCQGCCDGLLPKELSIEEWHDEYLKLAIYAISLVDENTKLQNQIDYLMDSEHLETIATFAMGCDECGKYKMDLSDAITENVQLYTENDKLRKLVNGWDFCSKTKGSTFDNCVGCPLFIQTPHSYRCTKNERMCELVIKVNYK